MSLLKRLLLAKSGAVPLEPVEHFKWEKVMNITPTSYESTQVLHPIGKSKPYQNDRAATEFVNKHLAGAQALETDADILRFASDSVSISDGFYLEMGVATGRSINFIAGLNPKKKIYGFDSFMGLPKEWDRGDTYHSPGTFKLKKRIALPLLKNVLVYKGWFRDTLPVFKQQILGDAPIALLHIDSDLYESARDVFQGIGTNIVPGTVIVFDELYNYPNFELHEWKALQEFLGSTNKNIKFIAYNSVNEQAVVKVI